MIHKKLNHFYLNHLLMYFLLIRNNFSKINLIYNLLKKLVYKKIESVFDKLQTNAQKRSNV